MYMYEDVHRLNHGGNQSMRYGVRPLNVWVRYVVYIIHMRVWHSAVIIMRNIII